MNGIIRTVRDGAFGLLAFALFGALIYEYGKRRETVEYLFERWETYQANGLWVAAFALALGLLLSLVILITEKIQARRLRRERRLVRKTEARVHAERDESDRIRERNRRQLKERWTRELEQQT